MVWIGPRLVLITNRKSYTGSRLPLNSMTLDAKIGILWIFWLFRAARHIWRVNCAKINWDRHGEAAHEIFGIERRFRRSKYRFSRFKKFAHEGIKEWYPVKVVLLPLLASLLWKQLQIDMVMLPITTSTSDELFSRVNINDYERPWTSKIRGFYWLCDLRLQRTLQEWTATKWLEIDRVCKQELL